MERDDIIEYSLDAHHSEEAGRTIRKKIYFVTILLTLVTCVEVMVGAYWQDWFPGHWATVRWSFIFLTLVKAAYIVMTFMHLGEERRNIRAIILVPYSLFALYIMYIVIWEANYVNWAWKTFL